MIYLLIFIILTIFAEALFLVNIRIAFEYVRSESDDNITIAFYTMNGVFRYKYEIPLVDVGHDNVRFRLVKEMGKKERKVGESRKKLKLNEIYDKYLNVKVYYYDNSLLIKSILDYLHRRLILARFDLDISEGTGNACQTALISGLLWSLAGIVTSILSNNFKTFRKCVRIRPCFNNSIFSVDFLCIFHIKLVHIIVVLSKIMKNRYKLHKAKQEIGGDISG